MTKLADELEALAKDSWQDISNTPVDTSVRVKAGNMTFIARIVLGASVTSDGQECSQWQAEHEGEHPPCWSGGACWESNEDEAMSLQPTHWQPIAAHRLAAIAEGRRQMREEAATVAEYYPSPLNDLPMAMAIKGVVMAISAIPIGDE